MYCKKFQFVFESFSGHTIVEEVKLTVVEFHDEKSTNLVTSAFTFNSDSALYLSQFLIDSVISSDSLDDLELIKGDNFNVADEELSSLDIRLSRALTYGSFPDWWSLLGSDSENGKGMKLRYTVELR
jgi:hypothetical protein